MMVETTAGMPIEAEVLHNYFRNLVNHFFKILPIREQNEESLTTYMQSLQAELLGCKGLVSAIQNDASYLTLLSILQYLIDNPECTVREVKREVFRAISICNKLKAQYASK
ncbi:MAG: hypothetical protein IJ298_00895 [Ruminococcus sp.]|nr:hypothetical protein [Ruminococcus sp.]